MLLGDNKVVWIHEFVGYVRVSKARAAVGDELGPCSMRSPASAAEASSEDLTKC